MSRRIVFAFFIVAAGLPGCGSGSNLVGGGANAAGMGPARCTAAGARQFLGQEMEEQTLDSARAYAGALRSRVVRPGDAVTASDVDPLRLNVEINEAGRIRRLRCG